LPDPCLNPEVSMMNRSVLTILFLLTAFFFFPPETRAAYQPGEEGTICLGCHQSKDLSLHLKNSEQLHLYVDGRLLGESSHKDLKCSSCHTLFSISDHPERQFKSRRAFTVSSAGICRQCHAFDKGDKRIHSRMLIALKDIVCVDCHGSHSIKTIQEDTVSCLDCHKYDMQLTLKDGSAQSLRIDDSRLKASVHNRLRCDDCHFGFSASEHPERLFSNKRDLTLVSTEVCRRCHFDKYTKTLESIHFNVMIKGNTNAPVCADCHGAHSIALGTTEKTRSARRCQKCHSDIYNTYVTSVHGKALLSDHNQDVPVCSDCHRAHDIGDPHLTDFRNNIPQMCGNCHANAEITKKYGLSTSVLQSYLEDFHGVTLTFYRKQEGPVRHIAVCIDCHGIHDITKTKGPNASVVKANLAKRCQKCHAGASENFPDAWISHYAPDYKRAPLVYAINLIYSIFIPFMIVGLVLQIILHIWRYAVNR
jgi:hypothetical protein